MKPTLTSAPDLAPLLVFGAHPDDIEFGCGGVVALETRLGRPAHLVICSRGESASNGSPEQRRAEAEQGAKLLGASLEFVTLDGDAHLEIKVIHAITLAAMIRRRRPGILLAPTLVENQHPDHARLGRLVRDAARLARYGGLAELRDLPSHSIGQLLYYALTTEAEPKDISPILIDVSAPEVVQAWASAMEAHASQIRTRNYVEWQLLRARSAGAQAGVDHAIALFPNDPVLVDSLHAVDRGARRF
ncbi:MAG: PIG-L family deacetylase [Verrucomicrobiota bacterium]